MQVVAVTVLAMSRQQTLDIHVNAQATFESFLAGTNDALVTVLQSLPLTVDHRCVYFWGTQGVGRSHLLQAVCHHRTLSGLSAAYVPLSRWRTLAPSILEGLEGRDVVCIDDVHAVVNNPAWELALFSLYNRAQEAGVPLFLSAAVPCRALSYGLSDLQSRFSAAAVFQMQDLSDTEKLQILMMRAQARGMVLSASVGQFLLSRYARSTAELLAQLGVLEAASLEAQHRLTIPFVKSVLVG